MQIAEAAKIVREFIDESHWDSSEMDIVDAIEALIEHANKSKKDYVDGYFDGEAKTPTRYRGEIFRIKEMRDSKSMIDPEKFTGIVGKKSRKSGPIKLLEDFK